MFSEAFLCTVMFEKEMDGISGQDEAHNKISRSRPHNNVHHAEEHHCCKVTSTGGHEEERHCHKWNSAVSSSQALTIPSRDAVATSGSLDLYTSWSSNYASLYKNYPDLHIGGDHILKKKDSGCVLECEDGPVLLSVDIDSSSPPTDLLEGPPEEGVLNSEDGNVLQSSPFSNSVLNGFLEKKMQELYKQCFEETLLTNGSPNPRWPYVLMANLNQMSLMVSQEQNMDQARAREAILQYLCSATSSEFVTPILHISGQDNKKRSSTLSKKLRP
ncbi:TLR adapter interacting with SLC15A4 on the lysosome-like [Rana temporaria]|uniref:TLR adapter interacting with SLC15A4 on the lysosome-like n=1 Tax=Rana temporaria TaxID=8407 RepID=UPI001AADF323|nr:TLR adapter interacting with SLC15A4 on the lysosome-like [Rana temporaria]